MRCTHTSLRVRAWAGEGERTGVTQHTPGGDADRLLLLAGSSSRKARVGAAGPTAHASK
jgi:hypothetical protein